MPWMTRTRKRNDKLQRTAAKRKAEEAARRAAAERANRRKKVAQTVWDLRGVQHWDGLDRDGKQQAARFKAEEAAKANAEAEAANSSGARID